MIDIDRPNIERGLQFFQQWFDGTSPNSPNNIPYHHLGSDSVVAVKGLHPLDTVIKLINGIHTTIRCLLLSMPVHGTVTGKLCLQIERQLSNDWLLCCFYSQDAEKVSSRLSSLEESLKKVVHPDSLPNLFLTTDGLTFNGQVVPVMKGRNKLPRLDVPAPTAEYVSKSMERLYSPAAKRQATELETNPYTQHNITHQPMATPVPRPHPSNYAQAVHDPADSSTITPPVADITIHEIPQDPAIKEFQATTQLHSASLADLKQCCQSLAHSQQLMNCQLSELSTGITQRFDIMAVSIEKLHINRNHPNIQQDFCFLLEENMYLSLLHLKH
jgi:hypothetical protein